MVRSITSAPTSFARLNACEGEISWSMRTTSARFSDSISLSSSLLPVPKYAAAWNPARFCVNVPTTSKPSVLASWRSSVSEASNSRSLTLERCTAATMARFDLWATSSMRVREGYQQSRALLLVDGVADEVAVRGELIVQAASPIVVQPGVPVKAAPLPALRLVYQPLDELLAHARRAATRIDEEIAQ